MPKVTRISTILFAAAFIAGCPETTGYLYTGANSTLGSTSPSVEPGLRISGHNLKPNSTVEVLLYSEPKSENGETFAAPTPRSLGNFKADKDGFFDVNSPISKSICGYPPEWAKPYVMGRDIATNAIIAPKGSAPVPTSLWFTYQPCP